MTEQAVEYPDKLPSVILKNTVIFKNPEIDLPFFLKVGKSSNLGLFLVNCPSSRRSINGIKLGVSAFHGRSAYFGSAICTDTEGHIYYDYDLKGVGRVETTFDEQDPFVIEIKKTKRSENSSGVWDLETALREKDIAEELLKKGLRTYRIGAIIKLDQIALPNGEIISIQKAQHDGYLQKKEQPVVGLRVYRTRKRLREFIKGEASQESLTRAKKIIETELDQTMVWQDYFNWFVKTLSKNLAILHKNGYYHSTIITHNITLAGELVDFAFESGSERFNKLFFKRTRDQKVLNDLNDAIMSLWLFRDKMVNLDLIPDDHDSSEAKNHLKETFAYLYHFFYS